MLSFPRSTLASPFLPATSLPPGLPGCGESRGSVSAALWPGPLRGNPLFVTGRSASQAWPGLGILLAVCGRSSAPAGSLAARAGPPGCGGEPRSLRELVPTVPI